MKGLTQSRSSFSEKLACRVKRHFLKAVPWSTCDSNLWQAATALMSAVCDSCCIRWPQSTPGPSSSCEHSFSECSLRLGPLHTVRPALRAKLPAGFASNGQAGGNPGLPLVADSQVSPSISQCCFWASGHQPFSGPGSLLSPGPPSGPATGRIVCRKPQAVQD